MKFTYFHIFHIYKEANGVADKLANLGENNRFGDQNDIFEDFDLLMLD